MAVFSVESISFGRGKFSKSRKDKTRFAYPSLPSGSFENALSRGGLHFHPSRRQPFRRPSPAMSIVNGNGLVAESLNVTLYSKNGKTDRGSEFRRFLPKKKRL
jgi:hypothetical protein